MKTLPEIVSWLEEAPAPDDTPVVSADLKAHRDTIMSERPGIGHPLWLQLDTLLQERDGQLAKDPYCQAQLRVWVNLIRAVAWQAMGDRDGYVEYLGDAKLLVYQYNISKHIGGLFDYIFDDLQAIEDAAERGE